jgi:cytochrome P450
MNVQDPNLGSPVPDHTAKIGVPPGPSTLFFLMRSRALADPYRIFDVFREIVARWGPVSSSRSGFRERTYFVADYAIADTVFRRHDAFTKYPHHTADLAKLQAMIGKGMLATHTDEEWASHRQSMARAFSKSVIIKNFGEIARRHVDTLLDDALESGAHVSNISELAMRFSGRVMSDILAPGHPFADENFLEIKRILDAAILDFHRFDYKRRARTYKAALRTQAHLLIETAAAGSASGGLLRQMMADEPDWATIPAARERLLDRTINLIVAGYETTATTLNWITHLLAAHPDVQDVLCAEVRGGLYGDGMRPAAFDENALLRRVISEAMRLHTVLWFNIRYVTRDVAIEGHRFENGARVMLLPFIANRSRSAYSNPDAFDPNRYLAGEPRPLFPFGNGPRVCIGRTLAEMEMQIFVTGVLKRFQLSVACAPNAVGGVLLQPDQDIKVRLIPLTGVPGTP